MSVVRMSVTWSCHGEFASLFLVEGVNHEKRTIKNGKSRHRKLTHALAKFKAYKDVHLFTFLFLLIFLQKGNNLLFAQLEKNL